MRKKKELTIITVVAKALLLSHMRFSCFNGPIKNIVLWGWIQMKQKTQ